MRKLLLGAGTLILITSIAGLYYINFSFGIIMLWGISGILIAYGLFLERLIKYKRLNRIILTGCAALT